LLRANRDCWIRFRVAIRLVPMQTGKTIEIEGACHALMVRHAHEVALLIEEAASAQ
jgi:hypothetical protein